MIRDRNSGFYYNTGSLVSFAKTKSLIRKKSSLPDLYHFSRKFGRTENFPNNEFQSSNGNESLTSVATVKSSQSLHFSSQSTDSGVVVAEVDIENADEEAETRLFSGSNGAISEGPSKFSTCENCGHELTKQSQVPVCAESPRSNCSLFSVYDQQSSYEFCRICHFGEDVDNPLIAPCKCKGSMTHVHHSCLQTWIKSSGNRHCELCGYQFVMKSKIRHITKWQKLAMTKTERRKICCSVFFHIVAITCVIWSLYVLIEKTALELKNGSLQWPFWTKLAVVAVGLTGGIAFMYVQCRTYYKLCNRLLTYNENITVQNRPVEELQNSTNTPKDDVISCNSLSLAANNRADHEIIVV